MPVDTESWETKNMIESKRKREKILKLEVVSSLIMKEKLLQVLIVVLWWCTLSYSLLHHIG